MPQFFLKCGRNQSRLSWNSTRVLSSFRINKQPLVDRQFEVQSQSGVNQCSLGGLYASNPTLSARKLSQSTLQEKTEPSQQKPNKVTAFWDAIIAKHGPDQIIADPSYNRWRIVPYAVSTHLCLGGVYAWSILNEPLSKSLGVVSQAANDWTMAECVKCMSLLLLVQGCSMAVLGKWIQRVGPKVSGITGGILYGSGLMVAGAGVHFHSLPLLYLGYGGIGGLGHGICYLGPIATLMKFFPDRKGLASGLAIAGLGGGGVLATTIKKRLLGHFESEPNFLGSLDSIRPTIENGVYYLDNGMREAVLATETQLNQLTLGNGQLSEGLYEVSTGQTGAVQTLFCLGAFYMATCVGGGWTACLPNEKAPYIPSVTNKVETSNDEKNKEESQVLNIDKNSLSVEKVVRLPQFYLQWITLLTCSSVGMGLLSCGSDIMNSCFVGTASFAATYVQLLSVANLCGRFGWATLSDKLGRKNTFTVFTCVGAPIMCSLPWILSLNASGDGGSTVALVGFCGASMAIISFFGGGFSSIPAYESDLYGVKNIAAIHGRMMTASAMAGMLGPFVVSTLYEKEKNQSIVDLARQCDPIQFEHLFGTSIHNLDSLIEAKAVSISKLMEIAPETTVDPSSALYNPAFYALSGLYLLGASANFMVRPVNKKHFEMNTNHD